MLKKCLQESSTWKNWVYQWPFSFCFRSDPYLNTDAGTMSPFEHGEVFVLDDGGEVKYFLLLLLWFSFFFNLHFEFDIFYLRTLFHFHLPILYPSWFFHFFGVHLLLLWKHQPFFFVFFFLNKLIYSLFKFLFVCFCLVQ